LPFSEFDFYGVADKFHDHHYRKPRLLVNYMESLIFWDIDQQFFSESKFLGILRQLRLPEAENFISTSMLSLRQNF
jgi:hypothetical protein